jgi:hypothetical protein
MTTLNRIGTHLSETFCDRAGRHFVKLETFAPLHRPGEHTQTHTCMITLSTLVGDTTLLSMQALQVQKPSVYYRAIVQCM